MPRVLAGIALLAAWSFAARAASFAFGIADQDEAFYLLHGGLWLQGHPPYTAVWDVKPPGLILIFAIIRMFATPGVLAARIAASLAVFLGALALWRFARRHLDGERTAFAAAFLYPPFTVVLWGATCPPELFLAPPVILGLDIVCGWWTGQTVRDARSAIAVGLLFGIAVLIKQTAVFELALAAIVAALPFARPNLRALVILLAASALPSLAYIAYEAGAGVPFETWSTPFLAAAQRLGGDGISFLDGALRALPLLKPIAPLLAMGLFCLPERKGLAKAPDGAAIGFVALWALASTAGLVAMRAMYAHYGLTLVAPLALLGAIWLRTIARRVKPKGRLVAGSIAALAVIWPLAWAPLFEIPEMRPEPLPRMAAAALKRLGMEPGDTLYVVDQDPMIYLLTGATIPTRYAFTQHLMCPFRLPDRSQADEIGRIMASQPRFVVIDHDRQWMLCERDRPENMALVTDALARDYGLAATVDAGRESVDIYRRKENP
ncbi:MAG TPA: hypothetical protein VKS60_03260 [Stellaceae bacterium]|nr:hypothetical protein [Stellaceae bacterium]